MIVGVPKEIKTDEYRVAMIPVGVEELTRAGHKVVVQAGAGQGSGIPDEDYARHGAEIVPAITRRRPRVDAPWTPCGATSPSPASSRKSSPAPSR